VMPLAKRGKLHAGNGNRQGRRHSNSFSLSIPSGATLTLHDPTKQQENSNATN
jgi:hypothetical protein